MSLSIFARSAPHAAVGIGPDRVAAVTVSGGAISAHGSEPLPPRAIDALLNGPNITDRAAVVAALRRVFDRLGHRPRRVALSLPDTVAKVSLLRFEKLPARAEDLDQLIRFQMRKAAPFHLEDAVIAHALGAPLEGGAREVVVVLARRDVVREYESVCEELGAHAGLVDLSTLSVASALAAGTDSPPGDWLLVHVTPRFASIAILRGGDLIFYRSRGDEADGNLADLVHQTAMYYEDRLGGGRFSRVVLVGGADSGDRLRRSLEERLRTQVAVAGSGTVRFADRIAADTALVDQYLPLVGLLQR